MALLRVVVSVKFTHYKAFKNFSINLQEFNVLAGPNNSGKSTIVGAFRILHEGLRKARAKNPERVTVDGIAMRGYKRLILMDCRSHRRTYSMTMTTVALRQ